MEIDEKPLDHVRGAVRVGEPGDGWQTVGPSSILGWRDCKPPMGGVWVRMADGAATWEPDITAEDFARRYGAAMGG